MNQGQDVSSEPQALAVIGLWGLFDIDEFDELIVERVTHQAISHRLPSATVHPFSPLGYTHPISFSGSDPGSALGRWVPDRLADLGAALDCVVIAGSNILRFDDERVVAMYRIPTEEAAEVIPSRFFIEGLGADLERTTPVIWSALRLAANPTTEQSSRLRSALRHRSYITVRGTTTRARLAAAGVTRDIEVVPNPAILAPDMLTDTLIAQRLAYLRTSDAVPASASVIVIEETPRMRPHVDLIVAAVAELAQQKAEPPVLLVANLDGSRDDEMVAALRAVPDLTVYRLAAEVILDDLVTVLASANAFLGTSGTAAAVAAGFGRPFALVGSDTDDAGLPAGEAVDRVIRETPGSAVKLAAALTQSPDPGALAAARSELDAHFDRVVELAVTAAERRVQNHSLRRGAVLDEHVQRLERAHARRGRQLVSERLAFADRSRDLTAQLDGYRQHVERLNDLNRDVERQATEAVAELRALEATTTFRMFAPIRRAYRRLRRWE